MTSSRVRILTVSEPSEYLHVHKTTIYRALRQENCPGFASETIGGLASTQSNSGSMTRMKDETGSQIDDELAPSTVQLSRT
jgi:hypothetical protein